MTSRKLLTAIAVPLTIAAVAAPVYASSHTRTVSEAAQEAHIFGLPAGYGRINMSTCKFAVKEVDLRPAANERYARAEDIRHDALGNCLRHHMNHPTPAKPDTDGVTGYTQVSASGTGKTVTATCPAGDVVLGGGSPDETTGSWPSSATSWSVRRDHLSPPTLTVTAVCATKAAS